MCGYLKEFNTHLVVIRFAEARDNVSTLADCKKVEVGDPSMQHLKFQSKQLAKCHAPPVVRARTIFFSNAICEKCFDVLERPFHAFSSF
jgi:hypothetical protein